MLPHLALALVSNAPLAFMRTRVMLPPVMLVPLVLTLPPAIAPNASFARQVVTLPHLTPAHVSSVLLVFMVRTAMLPIVRLVREAFTRR